MPTLGELTRKFSSALEPDSGASADSSTKEAADGGPTKTASEGGNTMDSMKDMYDRIVAKDGVKTAAAAAGNPQDDADLAKLAAQIAESEAEEQVAKEASGEAAAAGEPPVEGAAGDGEIDYVKVAQEYDAAGRIMARGFYDEFNKLAMAAHTKAPDNQMTESPSAAKTPSLGNRALPTMETNFAGSDAHNQGIVTKGGKQTFADSLAPKKKVNAGVTGDNPEAAAIAMGSGSPSGFATIKDL